MCVTYTTSSASSVWILILIIPLNCNIFSVKLFSWHLGLVQLPSIFLCVLWYSYLAVLCSWFYSYGLIYWKQVLYVLNSSTVYHESLNRYSLRDLVLPLRGKNGSKVVAFELRQLLVLAPLWCSSQCLNTHFGYRNLSKRGGGFFHVFQNTRLLA
jgi:hypothetical protein